MWHFIMRKLFKESKFESLCDVSYCVKCLHVNKKQIYCISTSSRSFIIIIITIIIIIVTLFILCTYIYIYIYIYMGHAVAQLVEAQCNKPEGRGFDAQWCHWNFH
jgi:hypothetical protein